MSAREGISASCKGALQVAPVRTTVSQGYFLTQYLPLLCYDGVSYGPRDTGSKM